jgi:DNA-binding winged helix-turn-helix (wHTH) protein
MPAAIRYRFGPFVLDPAIRQLARDGTAISLPPKAFDTLVMLVRTRDRVISKQELLDAIWPDTEVIENTLTQRIREIRDALEDDAQKPVWVETVSRVGYRFIGEVLEEPVQRTGPTLEPAAGDRGVAPPDLVPTGDDAGARQPAAPAAAAGEVRTGWRRFEPARWYAAGALVIGLGALAAWPVGLSRSASPSGAPRIESVAVLPLKNLSRDEEQE